MNQVRRLDFGVHVAVTGIGISDDHLLKIRGFRLIPVAAGGHLGSKIARTLPNLKNIQNLGVDRLLFKGAVPLGRTIADAWKEISYKPADINSNCDWQ